MTARPPLADTVRLPTACALDCTAMPSSPATVSRAMMEKVPSGGSSQATADGDKSANKSARTSLSFMARKPGLAGRKAALERHYRGLALVSMADANAIDWPQCKQFNGAQHGPKEDGMRKSWMLKASCLVAAGLFGPAAFAQNPEAE